MEQLALRDQSNFGKPEQAYEKRGFARGVTTVKGLLLDLYRDTREKGAVPNDRTSAHTFIAPEPTADGFDATSGEPTESPGWAY